MERTHSDYNARDIARSFSCPKGENRNSVERKEEPGGKECPSLKVANLSGGR